MTQRPAIRQSLSSHVFFVLRSTDHHMVFSSFLPSPRAMAALVPTTRSTCSRLHIWPGRAWLQFENLHVGPIPLWDKEILLTGGLICMSFPRTPPRLTDVSQTWGAGCGVRRGWRGGGDALETNREIRVYVTRSSLPSVLYQEAKCNTKL